MKIQIGDWVKRNNEYEIDEGDIAPQEIELEKLYEVIKLDVVKSGLYNVDCAILGIGPVAYHLLEVVDIGGVKSINY